MLLKDYLTFISTTFGILLVFGSYAKHKEKKNSDLDLLIIISDTGSKEDANQAIERCYAPPGKHFLILFEKEFLEMVKNTNQFNVGNEVIKNHIILYGGEQYYQLLNKSRT